MDPLASMDAFESTDHANIKPVVYLGSITRSVSFEMMPPEILDRIVHFVDSDSILPLCHALRYYKYISTAMFDAAHRFPKERYTPSKLWPNMCIPGLLSAYSKRVKKKGPVIEYARIVAKHGGNVTVPCSWNVLNYLGALPEVLSLSPGDINLGLAEFLACLAHAKKRIRSFVVEMDSANDECTDIAQQLVRLQIQSLIWNDRDSTPVAILDALPFISGLSYLELFAPEIIPENSNRLAFRVWVAGTL
ncbi:hypothetical protein HDU77_010900 [Chytriomyces hyalinus]|nr:hypothetical protein HDU77_010900 [Chytriomyces hyalinus]